MYYSNIIHPTKSIPVMSESRIYVWHFQSLWTCTFHVWSMKFNFTKFKEKKSSNHVWSFHEFFRKVREIESNNFCLSYRVNWRISLVWFLWIHKICFVATWKELTLFFHNLWLHWNWFYVIKKSDHNCLPCHLWKSDVQLFKFSCQFYHCRYNSRYNTI